MATRTLERGRVQGRRALGQGAAAAVRRVGLRLGDLVTSGAIAGIASGFVFLLANMGYATSQGKPALAPFMDISTIFHGTDQPASMSPTLDMLATGAVVHFSLSLAFGIVFALLVGALAPLLRNWIVLTAAGVAYGLALYVVNFQILGNTIFTWFTNPQGPDQGFEVGIHAVFGFLLVPFFVGTVRRLGEGRSRPE